MQLPGFLRLNADGLLLSVRLQPRASANEIGEALGNELKIRVTAPPVDSAANEALVRLLADKLGLRAESGGTCSWAHFAPKVGQAAWHFARNVPEQAETLRNSCFA